MGREDQQQPGEQGMLFEDQLPALDEALGYRGVVAQKAAGITYRQLDYWARTGLIQPSIRNAAGSGTQRLYSFHDIVILRIIKGLLDAGVSLQQVRIAIESLRDSGFGHLADLTLMSDGASVYLCNSAEDVIDLIRGGQGVFGIAVNRVRSDVEGELLQLPGEDVVDSPQDELAARRRTKGTAAS